jgi:hypothetical protein
VRRIEAITGVAAENYINAKPKFIGKSAKGPA